MKRYRNLYHKIYAMDNLELAYHDARKGKTWQKQIQRVDAHKEENLKKLQKMLMNHAFHIAEYRTITGSKVLIKQIKKYKGQIPFVATIKQVWMYYAFT